MRKVLKHNSYNHCINPLLDARLIDCMFSKTNRHQMSLFISDLCFSYHDVILLNKLSLSLNKGEIATLVGASGSGKSTLFKIATGLLVPQSGSITYADFESGLGSSPVAYMMQQDLLLPWRTVLSNVLLATELGIQTMEAHQATYRAKCLLKEVGLENFMDFYPEELSGGMRQRVSLARCLMQNRPILLLDEPFGALDVGLREQMYRLLHSIRNQYGTTILMVTHDFRDAISLSDRIFLLSSQTIQHEWSISAEERRDFVCMGKLQEELRSHLQFPQ